MKDARSEIDAPWQRASPTPNTSTSTLTAESLSAAVPTRAGWVAIRSGASRKSDGGCARHRRPCRQRSRRRPCGDSGEPSTDGPEWVWGVRRSRLTAITSASQKLNQKPEPSPVRFSQPGTSGRAVEMSVHGGGGPPDGCGMCAVAGCWTSLSRTHRLRLAL